MSLIWKPTENLSKFLTHPKISSKLNPKFQSATKNEVDFDAKSQKTKSENSLQFFNLKTLLFFSQPLLETKPRTSIKNKSPSISADKVGRFSRIIVRYSHCIGLDKTGCLFENESFFRSPLAKLATQFEEKRKLLAPVTTCKIKRFSFLIDVIESSLFSPTLDIKNALISTAFLFQQLFFSFLASGCKKSDKALPYYGDSDQ